MLLWQFTPPAGTHCHAVAIPLDRGVRRHPGHSLSRTGLLAAKRALRPLRLCLLVSPNRAVVRPLSSSLLDELPCGRKGEGY
jgi:hypothetical protein